MKRIFASAAGALALGMALPAVAQVAGVPLEMEPNTCDRACLEGKVEAYLQAMTDGVASEDLFARNARFTENGVEMPLGKRARAIAGVVVDDNELDSELLEWEREQGVEALAQ